MTEHIDWRRGPNLDAGDYEAVVERGSQRADAHHDVGPGPTSLTSPARGTFE
jgi:hypothetical protein